MYPVGYQDIMYPVTLLISLTNSNFLQFFLQIPWDFYVENFFPFPIVFCFLSYYIS